jgi:hypothetical protein
MQDKRKAKSCPRGLNHLSRPPKVTFPPIRRTQGKEEKKRREVHTQSFPSLRERRLDGVQLNTLFRTRREKRKGTRKSSRCALMASYSYRLPISVSFKKGVDGGGETRLSDEDVGDIL